MYQHQWTRDCDRPLPNPGKVVCVGRNYSAHAKELGNEVPDSPVLFIKPSTALQAMCSPITLRQRNEAIHYETELALLIGDTLANASREGVISAVAGIGLALDLTLRETQSQLKAKGHPWERAKAFDGSCPVSEFIPMTEISSLNELEFSLSINGKPRQHGRTQDMLFDVERLLVEISCEFTLLPGDIVLTGTPEGVGTLSDGDVLSLRLTDALSFDSSVNILA